MIARMTARSASDIWHLGGTSVGRDNDNNILSLIDGSREPRGCVGETCRLSFREREPPPCLPPSSGNLLAYEQCRTCMDADRSAVRPSVCLSACFIAHMQVTVGVCRCDAVHIPYTLRVYTCAQEIYSRRERRAEQRNHIDPEPYTPRPTGTNQ